MRFVEDDKLEVRQEFVLAGSSREFGVKRLDCGDDDMERARRLRPRLTGPHPGDAQPGHLRTDAGPYLPPRFDRLLAQFVSVRHPEDAAVKAIVTHRFDNRLHGNARLARSGSAC